jgi:hypothetical protein
VTLPFDHPEPRLHAGEPDRVRRHLGLQLRASQAQHPAKLDDVDPVVEDRLDLLQREAQILEGDEPVEPAQLPGVVGAVSADRISTTAGVSSPMAS